MPPVRLTALPAANKIFVDREEPQRTFKKAALTIPSDSSVLRVFYGVGGQGKTALCRELMRKTNAALEPSYSFLRRAVIDLHGRPKTDPDLLLVWIRNGFADAGVTLPCFDLALALVWEGTRGDEPFPTLTKPWLGRTTKAGTSAVGEGAKEVEGFLEGETATELLGEAIGEIPGVGFVLKRLGGWAINKSKRAWLERTRPHLEKLYENGELKPAFELSRLLPWMLAQDLNFHLAANPNERFVLFIDEYERVFDQGGAGARWAENPFDRHMRDFIKETNGLLAVFFSRERLPWGDDPEWRDDLVENQHLLGGLADHDADAFLKAIPIEDEDMRMAIIAGARESSAADAPVYPLMLDLQVEHWRSLTARGNVSRGKFKVKADTFNARCNEIIERVLRDYDLSLQTTIERLSVARRFDKAAFKHIITTFQTGLAVDQFDRLADLSFVTRSPDGFLSFHNVIAASIREQMLPEKKETSIDALFEHFSTRAKVASHFDLTADNVSALFDASYLRRAQGMEGFIDWLESATELLSDGARYEPNAALWREALAFSEQAQGPEHPSTGTTLNNLAGLLYHMGDYAGAKPLLERALAISEKANGPEHPTTGIHLNNFAELLRAIGDYVGAKPLFERALTISEKANGPEHPTTGIHLNSLAVQLMDLGDYAGAKTLCERALAISEKANGREHPTTGIFLNSFAELLRAMGDYAGAKPLSKRALAISEQANGPEHPTTGTRLNNLALLLRAMGDYAGAKPFFEQALAISEKAQGPEHPSTGKNLDNLAGLLQEMGDYVGAKPLFERALAISEQAEGPEHPSTGTTLNNLAGLLTDMDDYAKAKPLFERALAINEKAQGPEHPSTGTTLNNLAGLLYHMGDYAGAKPLLERALAISEKANGPEHPETKTIHSNLTTLQNELGRR
jgi:tetratricopeptide (TPR) repeat protein